MTNGIESMRDETAGGRTADCESMLQLIPLSIQREGDLYLVGSRKLNRFYQMPEAGVQIIHLLQEGLSLSEVKQRFGHGRDHGIDIDDFVSTLAEIGFTGTNSSCKAVDSSSGRPKRWVRLAGRVAFSWPLVLISSLVVLYAAICLGRFPQAMPSLKVFYFPGHLTGSLLLLLVLRLFLLILHEWGHMLAAARVDIDSRLGIGNRLWTIVIETDLTGVFSLPRRKRYLPLLAGMLVDIVCIALLLLVVIQLIGAHANSFLIQLLQALILQTLLVMLWQTNIFLRTDLYYVLGTLLGYPDLDRDARIYLRALTYRLSRGHLGMTVAGSQQPKRLGVIRAFSLLWLTGRIASVYFLLAVGIPTLFLYAKDTFKRASWDALPYDSILFTVFSAVVVGVGLWMWLSRMKLRRLTDRQ